MSANQSPVYAARLAEARKTYDATADKYNALPVPTLEALSVALRTDAWLAAVVYRAAQHQALGYGGADMIPASFRTADDCQMLHHLFPCFPDLPVFPPFPSL